MLRKPRLVLALSLVLFLGACKEDPRPPQRVADPNVPPSTPTVTRVAPGFDAPASPQEPGAAPAPSSPQPVNTALPRPAPSPNPLVSKLGPREGLYYISVPALGAPRAGDHIDVLGVVPVPPPTHDTRVSTADSGDETTELAMLVLQNIRVLDTRKPANGVAEAGLAVSPDEVETLLALASEGTLAPLLRASGDHEVHPFTQRTFREKLEDLEIFQQKRQIRRNRSTGVGTGRVTPGERGLVLPHDLPDGVLTSGTQVDVYGLFDTEGGHVTINLLQDVDVIAADVDELQLSVTVDEAEMLMLSDRRGTLHYVLRGSDRDVTTIQKKTTREVLQDLQVIQEKRLVRVRKKPRRKAPGPMIEIIAGDTGGGGVGAGVAAYTGGRAGVRRPYEPPTTEEYTNPEQNDWVATAEDRLSTFAADVDSGSFTIARRKFEEGKMPPIDSVRPEEWVNYFTYNYPQPRDGAFGVSLEAAPSPFQTEPNYRLLRVGIQGKSLAAAERPPVHLTFLVDVSGSMSSDDRLGLAKQSLETLVESLQPADTVAITTYAGRTETVLQPTSVESRDEILAAIGRLSSGGGTAMDDGLKAAYELAETTFVEGHENRVLVLSDGDANLGRTGLQDMLATIERGAKRGITMSTIGFGMGNYKDSAMEQLANKGEGNYYYIDDIDEARRVFGEQLDATLITIAREVKLQVEFDPNAVKRYRLIGYENRDIADRDFRNDSVDAGEVGAGHSVTALYELEMTDPSPERIATVRIRHRSPDDTGPTLETTAVMRGVDMAEKLADTSHAFRFAASVAAFAEIVRQSPYAAHLNVEWVQEVASGAVGTHEDRAEFVALLNRAKSLGRPARVQ